jgi:hypothetical protein
MTSVEEVRKKQEKKTKQGKPTTPKQTGKRRKKDSGKLSSPHSVSYLFYPLRARSRSSSLAFH